MITECWNRYDAKVLQPESFLTDMTVRWTGVATHNFTSVQVGICWQCTEIWELDQIMAIIRPMWKNGEWNPWNVLNKVAALGFHGELRYTAQEENNG